MISVSISIDVPNMTDGMKFYFSAFGFSKVAEPVPGIVVLRSGEAKICLLERVSGSSPCACTQETRHYERHWTPVHIDIHVDDFKATLARAIAAGAKQEKFFEANSEHGAVAFCSDPFGHGFCLIERRNK